MGTGFYGISLDVSPKVMLMAIKNHLLGRSNLSEELICVMDKREYLVFEKNWEVKEKG